MTQPDVFDIMGLEDLLNTNRPPTTEEKRIVQESVAPLDEKLRSVGAKISDLLLEIQRVNLQVEQMEIELQRLGEEEAAIIEASAGHRRALSPFRTLPDDILREICMACMIDDTQPTASSARAMPVVLSRISSGMRIVALTNPILWASFHVEYNQPSRGIPPTNSIRRRALGAKEWLQRSGGLPLAISVTDTNQYQEDDNSNISNELFDILLSHSSRWQDIQFKFAAFSTPFARIASLSAVDVPLLRSLSLYFKANSSILYNSAILTVPTLKILQLDIRNGDIANFAVNWKNLTALVIHGNSWAPDSTLSSIARVLRQTRRLVFFHINVGPTTEIGYTGEIHLPYLRRLWVNELVLNGSPGLLNFLNAPILDHLELVGGDFLESSLSTLLQRSLKLRYFSLEFDKVELTPLVDPLYHCRSLISLCIDRRKRFPMRRLLHPITPETTSDAFFKAFVCDGERGYLCPRLQNFSFRGSCEVSVDAIRQFLTGKKIDMPELRSWTSVVVDTQCIRLFPTVDDTSTAAQITELIAEQRAAGLNVSSG